MTLSLYSQITKTSKLANDEGLGKKLWEVSEKFVKLLPEERHFWQCRIQKIVLDTNYYSYKSWIQRWKL